MKKIIAVILSLVLIMSAFSVGFVSSAEDNIETPEEFIFSAKQESKFKFATSINKVLDFILNEIVFGIFARMIPDNKDVENLADFNLDEYADFYEGTETFLDAAEDDARWYLGYDKESIIPDDFGVQGKYARGSYIPYWYSTEVHKDEDGNDEDLNVRTIAINDGTDRGTAIFATVDCVGLSNYDVRKIRAAVADFAEENNIISINVSASHTHTGIDSQGAWNNPFKAAFNNMAGKDVFSGVNADFLNKVIDATALSIKTAYENLQSGTLTYYKYDATNYVRARTTPRVCDQNMYILKFTPDEITEESKNGTYISSFGVHPEIVSYDWLGGLKRDTKLSADFIYYIDKIMEKAGYNFIYIQGNVGTNVTDRFFSNDNVTANFHDSAMRYGYEVGYVMLCMDKSIEECIAINEATGDLLGVSKYAGKVEGYTTWYEDGFVATETFEVEPYLNIRSAQMMFTAQSNVAKLLSKAGVASNKLVKDGSKYYFVTEIGYVEFGNAIRAVMNPGELYSELLVGNEKLSQVNGGFEYDCLRDCFGEDIILFDLMNDAVGYLAPDNYYVLAGIQYDAAGDIYESESWCFLVSPGKNAASEFFAALTELMKDI